jgi:hypothetical protein
MTQANCLMRYSFKGDAHGYSIQLVGFSMQDVVTDDLM